MGQIMGSFGAREVDLYMDDKPTFDPQAGFSYQRKQREMIANEADLVSAKIPIKYRDYCAHHLLEYQSCRYKNMPMLYKCAHEKHAYLICEKDESHHQILKWDYGTTWEPPDFNYKKNQANRFTQLQVMSYVLRMKEFERERRLRIRERRLVSAA